MPETASVPLHSGAAYPDASPETSETGAAHQPRIVFTHRDDSLVPYLGRALRTAFDVVDDVEVVNSASSKMLIGAVTIRRDRAQWGERYIKSALGHSARSRGVRRRLATGSSAYDVVFQTHALYRVDDPRTVIYVDCTHRQSAEHWPGWNPLRGRALARWFEREQRQYLAAAHVFAFCEATRRTLVDDYGVPAERVSVVGAGLDFAELPEVPERDFGSPVLLFVGNDFVRKGGPELLAAFARLREQVPQARLRLVGTGCPAVDQPGVEVLGAVSGREELSEIYAGATVFCLPSHFEPFGLVLLEAMAHGLPCVGTDSCGIPDIIVDKITGSVVPRSGDLVDSLTETLLALVRSPQTAHRMGDAGRQRVLDQFLWSHVTQRMRPVLEDLARRGPSVAQARSPRTRTTGQPAGGAARSNAASSTSARSHTTGGPR